MSRKSLTYFLIAIAATLVVVAVAFLRYDSEEESTEHEVSCLTYAVPSNAVMVSFLSEARNLQHPIFTSFDFAGRIAAFVAEGNAGVIADRPAALSLQYSGELAPLYVFDAGEASDVLSPGVEALMDFVRRNGFQAEYVNCSTLAPGSAVSSRSLVLVARTNTQISTSKRHLSEGSSINDASGFADAVAVSSENSMMISYEHVRTLFEKGFSRQAFNDRYGKRASHEYSAAASFVSTFGDWAVLDLGAASGLHFVQTYASSSDFMSVMSHPAPSVSELASVLPHNTVFALTLPMTSSSVYVSSYEEYLSSVQKLLSVQAERQRLKLITKTDPRKFADALALTEVATAAIPVGKTYCRVNLLKGEGIVDSADSVVVMPYEYAGYVASVFGKAFSLKDESAVACIDGWTVTGSKEAVEEYVRLRSSEPALGDIIRDSGEKDFFSQRMGTCFAYINYPAKDKSLSRLLKKNFQGLYDSMREGDGVSPMVLSVYTMDGRLHTDIDVYHFKVSQDIVVENK